MGRESYEIGKKGEETAAKYLLQQGYEILERNYRSHQGEVDIIARDGRFLVFVEVKNYSFRSLGSPLGAVRKNKRQSVIHAAETYLWRNKIRNTYCRFDVVALYLCRDGSQAMELYKNAFFVN
jgi:putative endonuclease